MPPAEQMRNATREQLLIMAEAGADVICLEMMIDQPCFELTLDAATDIGLPVWVGLTTTLMPDGDFRLHAGDPLAPAIALSVANDVDLINIMHTEVEFVAGSIDAVRQGWDGPIGVYAHSSTETEEGWVFEDVISPVAYCDFAIGWKAQGISVIGGCCGTSPSHVESMRERLF